MEQTLYAYRLHDRNTEDDPNLATIMYSTSGPDGPWYDIATCQSSWVDDVLGALQWREEIRMEEARRQEAQLRLELKGYDKLVDVNWDENKFDITLENQGSAKPASNLVDRLRNINPYSPQQVVKVCREAAEALEASGG